MTQRIKYIIKGKPTRIKKVASFLMGMSILLFLIVDFLYTPLKSLPFELQVFAIGELIPSIFFDFNAIIILLFCLGLVLYFFRWRRGELILTDEKIVINGIPVLIVIEKITEVTFFDSDFVFGGGRRLVLIKGDEGIFKIKFKTDDSFTQFAEQFVLSTSKYEHIKIKSSVLYHQN